MYITKMLLKAIGKRCEMIKIVRSMRSCGWGKWPLMFYRVNAGLPWKQSLLEGSLFIWEVVSPMDFPGGSDSKHVCLQCQRPGFNAWVGKIPWRRKWQPILVFLPGKSHGQRSLVGYSPWGREELDTTEQLHFHRVEVRECGEWRRKSWFKSIVMVSFTNQLG